MALATKRTTSCRTLADVLFRKFRSRITTLTKPSRAPTICDAEVMFKSLESPVGPFADVEAMIPRLQPPWDDLNAGHEQALSRNEVQAPPFSH